MTREIVLDIETTGLYVQDGHRIVEIAALEMVDGVPTGAIFSSKVNPDRDIPDEVVKVHGITNEKVQNEPFFAQIAQKLAEFISDSQIVITCRTDKTGYTLDTAFLNTEMERAGFPAYVQERWVNVRRWSEAMFGNDNASLDKVLDRYGIDRSQREKEGHSAGLDARLLADVYPRLLNDYIKFKMDENLAKASNKKTLSL